MNNLIKKLKNIRSYLLGNNLKIERDQSLQLDSLRGFSALVVLIAHANQIFITPIYPGYYWFFGLIAQASVMIFFVLSGFFIFKSIARNYHENGNFILSEYLTDRMNRIYPPLIFSILLVLILYALSPYLFSSESRYYIYPNELNAREGFFVKTNSVVGSVFFLNGFLVPNLSSNAPLWSLSYEVFYYLLIGLFFYSRGFKGFTFLLLIIFVLGLLSKTFILYGVVWFSGVVLGFMQNKGKIKKTPFIIVFFPLFILSLYIGFSYKESFSIEGSILSEKTHLIAIWNFLIGLAFACFMGLILNNSLKFTKIFNKAAKYSYTLYIIHFPLFLFIYGVFENYFYKDFKLAVFISLISVMSCITISYFIAKKIEGLKIFRKLKLFNS